MTNYYLSTVALEKNRWTSREPSFLVSDYLPQIAQSDFVGIELWENHFLKASAEEKIKLLYAQVPCLYNTYLEFAHGITPAHIEMVATARMLQAKAVKFNVSNQLETIPKEIETLRQVRSILPPEIIMLCECHPGTVAEKPEEAARILKALGDGFGAIVHLDPEHTTNQACFAAYGAYIKHLHMNVCKVPHQEQRCRLLEHAERTRTRLLELKELGFACDVSLEFTGDGETIAETYQNALKDLRFVKEVRGE